MEQKAKTSKVNASAKVQSNSIWDETPQKISNAQSVALIKRYKENGDEAALEKVVAGYMGHAKKFFTDKSLAKLKSPNQDSVWDVEDLYQDAGVAIVSAVQKFDYNQNTNFELFLDRALLRMIGKKVLYNNAQKRTPRTATKQAAGLVQPAKDDAEYIRLHKRANAAQQQLDDILNDHLDMLYIKQYLLPQLSKQERQTFEDYYFNHLTKAEVGKKLNITKQAAENRLNKIMEKILRLHNEGTMQEPMFSVDGKEIFLKDVERYVDILPDNVQKYVNLRFAQGMSAAEIAKLTGVSKGVIFKKIGDAKKDLQNMYVFAQNHEFDQKFSAVLSTFKPTYQEMFLEYAYNGDNLKRVDLANKYSIAKETVTDVVRKIYQRCAEFDDLKMPQKNPNPEKIK